MPDTPLTYHPMTLQRKCPFDPPEILSELREQDPVRITTEVGDTPWLFTRYVDVKALLLDPRVSSEPARDGFPAVNEHHAASRRAQQSFFRMDPPVHDEQRAMLSAWFSVRKAREMAQDIERITDELLGEFEAAGPPADLVHGFAFAVPARVTCLLLGMPDSDSHFLKERVDTWFDLRTSADESLRAMTDVTDYFDNLVTERSGSPAGDLVSELIERQLVPGNLSRRHLNLMLLTLLLAAFDTTANTIALSTVVLLQNPGQLEALRADPGLWPGAIEELLRYLTPAYHHAYRALREDTEISGTQMRVGEGLIACTPAANRDPAMFEDPDRFDVRRANARSHLSFGHGIHVCLGQQLVRVELGIIFQRLFSRFPNLRLATEVDQLRFKTDEIVYGLYELPLSW